MAGRPKKKLDLPAGWQKAVLALYVDGASDVEIKAWIYEKRGTFSDDLWDRWLIEEPDFSVTIKKGRIFARAWWEKQGRTNLKTSGFNTALYQIQVRNRFGWDRVSPEDDRRPNTADFKFTVVNDES